MKPIVPSATLQLLIEAIGLAGIVVFLMSRSPQISAIQAPAIVLVEAKRSDLRSGFGAKFDAGFDGLSVVASR